MRAEQPAAGFPALDGLRADGVGITGCTIFGAWAVAPLILQLVHGKRAGGAHARRSPALNPPPVGTSINGLNLEIAPGLRRIGSDIVNSYLVVDGGDVTVVDAGLPGYWRLLKAELAAIGKTLDHVRALVSESSSARILVTDS